MTDRKPLMLTQAEMELVYDALTAYAHFISTDEIATRARELANRIEREGQGEIMTETISSKKYYAICHRKDPVNGSSISVGGLMGGDDLEGLSNRLSTMIWRRNNRPSIARIYLTETEELVKTIDLNGEKS